MPPVRSTTSKPKTHKHDRRHTTTDDKSYLTEDHKPLPPTNLKSKLAITPKTASLLQRCGYHDYHDLRHSTPNQIVAQLTALSGITPNQAETYRRGLRRMVWLATKDEPEELAKIYQNWSVKALTVRGWWVEGYDDMTGDQADQHISMIKGAKG